MVQSISDLKTGNQIMSLPVPIVYELSPLRGLPCTRFVKIDQPYVSEINVGSTLLHAPADILGDPLTAYFNHVLFNYMTFNTIFQSLVQFNRYIILFC